MHNLHYLINTSIYLISMQVYNTNMCVQGNSTPAIVFVQSECTQWSMYKQCRLLYTDIITLLNKQQCLTTTARICFIYLGKPISHTERIEKSILLALRCNVFIQSVRARLISIILPTFLRVCETSSSTTAAIHFVVYKWSKFMPACNRNE